MSIRWIGFPLWVDYWLFGRIRLLVVALIAVAAVTLLLTTISSGLFLSKEELHDASEGQKALRGADSDLRAAGDEPSAQRIRVALEPMRSCAPPPRRREQVSIAAHLSNRR
jgi:hypothetical protein